MMKTNIFLVVFALFLHALAPSYFNINNPFTVLPDQVYAGPTKGDRGSCNFRVSTLQYHADNIMVTPNLTGVYQQG